MVMDRTDFEQDGRAVKFDHIGVVTRSLARGRSVLEATVGVEAWTRTWEDSVNGVLIQFGRDASGVCYELLVPHGPDSPLKEALATRKAILNHVAYLVPDLAAGEERMREAGCAPSGPAKPAIAYGGRRIQFFVTPLWLIVELIEAPGHQHVFDWSEELSEDC
jgi:methylmalonyl-CoA/ethylmalonyl-CoA epimerase